MVIEHHTAPNKRKGGRTARQAQGSPKPERVSQAGCARGSGSWRGDKGTAHARGYTARWQRTAKRFLDDHPLCVFCEKRGVIEAATVVDHITPHRGDEKLFWDINNFQSLCKLCHDSTKKRIENYGEKKIGTDVAGWPIEI